MRIFNDFGNLSFVNTCLKDTGFSSVTLIYDLKGYSKFKKSKYFTNFASPSPEPKPQVETLREKRGRLSMSQALHAALHASLFFNV